MKLAIYGAGGMGREVMMLAREAGIWEDSVFVVDPQYRSTEEIQECAVLSLNELGEKYNKSDVDILICVGEPTLRKRLYEQVTSQGFHLGRFVDPSVKIHHSNKIERGAIVLPGCTLASDVSISCNTAVSFGVLLGHDTVVGEHCYLAPGTITGGFVKWGECSLGGLGCTVREHISIGKYSVVGQGAVVIKDVPDYTTVVGNPARQLGQTGIRKVFK